MARVDQKVIHARLDLLDPIPLNLIVGTMDYLSGLKHHVFRAFKFTPNEDISCQRITGHGMSFSSTDQINFHWQIDLLRFLSKSISTQLMGVIIAPRIDLAILGQYKTMHGPTNHLGNLQPQIQEPLNFKGLSTLEELLFLSYSILNNDLKLITLSRPKTENLGLFSHL
jgi:hypothetical protein